MGRGGSQRGARHLRKRRVLVGGGEGCYQKGERLNHNRGQLFFRVPARSRNMRRKGKRNEGGFEKEEGSTRQGEQMDRPFQESNPIFSEVGFQASMKAFHLSEEKSSRRRMQTETYSSGSTISCQRHQGKEGKLCDGTKEQKVFSVVWRGREKKELLERKEGGGGEGKTHRNRMSNRVVKIWVGVKGALRSSTRGESSV